MGLCRLHKLISVTPSRVSKALRQYLQIDFESEFRVFGDLEIILELVHLRAELFYLRLEHSFGLFQLVNVAYFAVLRRGELLQFGRLLALYSLKVFDSLVQFFDLTRERINLENIS